LKTRIIPAPVCVSLFAAGGRAQSQASPALEEATRLNNEVVKLYAAGKYAEALQPAERAVELREKELGRDHTLVAGALLNLAAVEEKLSKFDDARGHYRRAASGLEKSGDEAARRPLINAVEGEARLEPDINSSVRLHKHALELKEKAFGPDSPEVARSLFPLGHLNDLLGNREEAGRYFRRFIEIVEKRKTGAEDDVAVAYLRLGCLASKEGRRAEADDFGARALATFAAASDRRAPVEGGVINGKAISKPQPAYPQDAMRARASGTIVVEVVIGENGAVLSACARGEGHPSLKVSSEFAAYRARFTPTLVNGKPIKVKGVITYRFVLR